MQEISNDVWFIFGWVFENVLIKIAIDPYLSFRKFKFGKFETRND